MSGAPQIDPSLNPALGRPAGLSSSRATQDFRQLLDQFKQPETVAEIKFSTHAAQRLERRGIVLGPAENQRIMNGMSALSGKGIKEGLIVMDTHRFVVSVPNKTVITALNAKDQDVYTNIQGVVFS